MSLLEEYGLAMRDGVYESFMEVAQVTDLKELKDAGYSVKEILMKPDHSQWDKLLLLVKDETIICGCTIVVNWSDTGPFLAGVHVEFLEGLQAKEALRRLKDGLNESLNPSNIIN